MGHDLAHAFRSLRRSPGFTVAAVLTLALGIGATTTLVSVVDTLMFRPPAGVRDPERLVRPYFHFSTPSFGSWTGPTVSYLDFTDLRDHVAAFSNVGAFYSASTSLGRGAEARPVAVTGVSGSYFGTLGAGAWRGRLIQPDDDVVGAPEHVAVLSERFWRVGLGADPGVMGRELLVGNEKYTVVGITGPGFAGPDLTAPDLWIPLSALARTFTADFATQRNDYFIRLIGRLRPGATAALATQQATATIAAGRADSSVSNGFKNVVMGPVQEARGPEASRSVQVALWLVLMSGIVLLVACANVGNLLLARGLARTRELAIRKALGARRSDLVRELVAESLALAFMGGVAAALLCLWGGGAVRRFLLPPEAAASFHLDLRLCSAAAALSLLAGLLAGVLPALRVASGDLTPALKEGGIREGYRRSRLRSALVVAQIALSVLLVIGAGLFVRSLRNAMAVDTGYDLSRVVMVSVDLAAQGYDGTEVAGAFAAMQDAVRHDPRVESAAISVGGPFSWSFGIRARVAGRDSLPRLPSGGPYLQVVTPEFLSTVGLRVVQGRDFAPSDRVEGDARVAVINQTMARLVWPGGSPLGECLYLGDEKTCTTIVGVVEDGRRQQAFEAPQMGIYRPMSLHSQSLRGTTLYVRVGGKAAEAASSIRDLAQRAVPNLPYIRAQALSDIVAPQYDAWRMGATMFSLFGGLALLLAAIGVYGLVAYAVRGRQRELGIRLALGAPERSLVRLVVREGALLALAGLGLGLAAALGGGRAMGSVLYGVKPADPAVLIGSSVVLALAATAACVIPARRAARVDPMEALRAD
jgi:predicted permease